MTRHPERVGILGANFRSPGGIAGLIFDLDGTLVDSGLDFAAIRRDLGIDASVGLIEYQESLRDPLDRNRVGEAIHAFEMAGARRATWMPGARELLTDLAGRGLPLGIVTRNMREAVDLMVANLAIPVEMVLTREDCLPKPDPDGLWKISRAWGLAPETLIYVGDFRFDLEAARNAGMGACLYRNARNGQWAPMADWVIHHFDELRQMLIG